MPSFGILLTPHYFARVHQHRCHAAASCGPHHHAARCPLLIGARTFVGALVSKLGPTYSRAAPGFEVIPPPVVGDPAPTVGRLAGQHSPPYNPYSPPEGCNSENELADPCVPCSELRTTPTAHPHTTSRELTSEPQTPVHSRLAIMQHYGQSFHSFLDHPPQPPPPVA